MSAISQRLQSTRLWRVFFGPKKYECVLYFIGPRSKWLGKPDADEVIRIERCATQGFAAALGRAYKRKFEHIDWVVRDADSGEFVCGYLPASTRP